MKFGISFNTAFYGVDPDMIVAVARHAEALGFESFYMSEHVALYRGATVGSIQIDPTVSIVDPLETLSFVAAATERILLGTGVHTADPRRWIEQRRRTPSRAARCRLLPRRTTHAGRACRSDRTHALHGTPCRPRSRCTRVHALELDAELVAARAAEGVDRLVVSSGATDLDEHLAELSMFADRIGLEPPDADSAR